MKSSREPSMHVKSLLKQANSSFDEIWPEIENLIKKIFNNEPLKQYDWQQIFWNVHITLLWNPDCGDRLKERLMELFKYYMFNEYSFISVNSQDDLSLLNAYMISWRRFMFYYNYVPLPFAPLERLKQGTTCAITGDYSKKVLEMENFIRNAMVELWINVVFVQFKTRLVLGAMSLIDSERNKIQCHSHLIVAVKESCVYLSLNQPDRHLVYRLNFERVYLATMEKFYQTKGNEFFIQHGVLSYMRWVDQKIKEETDRANRYLEPHSLSKVIASIVNVLVAQYRYVFAEKFLDLIKSRDIENLVLMFTLLDRVENGIDKLLKNFEQHIINIGIENLKMEAITILQDSEKYIDSLLKLFNLTTSLINEAFNFDSRFMTTRDIAFNHLINDKSVFTFGLFLKQSPQHNLLPSSEAISNPVSEENCLNEVAKKTIDSRNAELFANYCDMLLRKTNLSRHLSPDQIETKLRNLIVLLKYLQDKDMFMKFYKAHLTRRLILDVSVDGEKEEMMVQWLREVGMPADYVNKLNRMFQDLKVSEDFNHQFKLQHLNGICDFLNVKILNSSTWSRNFEKVNVLLPIEIEELLPRVETFYKNKHSGRNLFWHHQFSYGVIVFHSDMGSYDLDVTSYQMSILYCWNDRCHDSITFETLSLSTQLPKIELRKALWSLVSNLKLKLQLVMVDSPSNAIQSFRDFNENTKFKLNMKFALFGKTGKTMKRGRFNLIGRLQLQAEKSREEETENIFRLRSLRMQEAIMKILKTRKTINFQALQLELAYVLKDMFIPNKSLIKEQIEWLIENEYIARDSFDNNTFHFNI